MEPIQIMWVDDEIDLLKPHLLFLEKKGYEVTPVTSGNEAIDKLRDQPFDLVFLDENMPGLTGLETLPEMKNLRPGMPVVMVTKSEEEYLMDDAIGSQIADYLIKPVNPKQILLSIKKIVDQKRLVSEKVTTSYQQDFRNLAMELNENLNPQEWIEVYRKLVYWELQLEQTREDHMYEILNSQKAEANNNFFRFVQKNYRDWISDRAKRPMMSHDLLREKVFPEVEGDEVPTFFVLIDNLRYDQWKVIEPLMSEYFRVHTDECYYSIVPTATHYARNAIFSGLMPLEIQKRFPKWWINDDEEGGKNLHEEDFLIDLLSREKRNFKFTYNKITKHEQGKQLVDNLTNLLQYDLNVIVYNFIDMLSHMRTEMEVIKELAEDESAYRSLTRSWFEHSPLYHFLSELAEHKARVVLSTDHGSVKVSTPSKVIGDRNTTTNLRYKHGKSLNYKDKDVFVSKKPAEIGLPSPNMSSAYIFAKEDYFFVYPNNQHYYTNFYRDTIQHGGISLEEMIIPVVTLTAR